MGDVRPRRGVCGKSPHLLQVFRITRLMSGRDLCWHHLHTYVSLPSSVRVWLMSVLRSMADTSHTRSVTPVWRAREASVLLLGRSLHFLFPVSPHLTFQTEQKFALSQRRNRFGRSGGCHGNTVWTAPFSFTLGCSKIVCIRTQSDMKFRHDKVRLIPCRRWSHRCSQSCSGLTLTHKTPRYARDTCAKAQRPQPIAACQVGNEWNSFSILVIVIVAQRGGVRANIQQRCKSATTTTGFDMMQS